MEPAAGETTASTETAAGEVVGSPPYMAPEQLLGKGVDARTDMYGAGACLYELATGKRPYGDKSGAAADGRGAARGAGFAAERERDGVAGPGGGDPEGLDKDPGLRYQTAKELLVDLERLQAAATSGAASQPKVVVKPRRRRWPWLATAGALVAITAANWLVRQSAPLRLLESAPSRADSTPAR